MIFAGSFLYRFLDLSFHNDHFEFLSLGGIGFAYTNDEIEASDRWPGQ